MSTDLTEKLCDAARYGDLEGVKTILKDDKDGSSLGVCSEWGGTTALHLATIAPENSRQITELLLQAKANPNAKDEDRRTPLHYATENDSVFGFNLQAIQLLLVNKADPNCKDQDGLTPLHNSVQVEDLADPDHLGRIERMLLENKSAINAQDKQGNTPLHFAAKSEEWGRDNIISLLLSAKAEVHKRNNESRFTALHYALTSVSQNSSALRKVKLLLEARANPNLLDAHAYLPINHAISGKWLPAIQLLAEEKTINLNRRDVARIPLHQAIYYGPSLVAMLLQTKKIAINLKNKKGDTPLHHAVKNMLLPASGDYPHRSLIKLLIENRAKLSIKDAKGHTPLELLPNPPSNQLQRDIRHLLLTRMRKTALLSSLHPRAGKKSVIRKATADLLEPQIFRIIGALAYGPSPLRKPVQPSQFSQAALIEVPDQKISPTMQVAQIKSALQVFDIALPQTLVLSGEKNLAFLLNYPTEEMAQGACNHLQRILKNSGIDLESLKVEKTSDGWFFLMSQQQRLALLRLPPPLVMRHATSSIRQEFSRYFNQDKHPDKEPDAGPGQFPSK